MATSYWKEVGKDKTEEVPRVEDAIIEEQAWHWASRSKKTVF